MNTKKLAVAALAAVATFTLSAQSQPQLPFPDLVGPLKATPGCLGVETARTASGKMVLAIASLTLSNQPPKGFPLPVSQITIELYQPLPGGVFVGGKFAPNSVKVPGMRDFSPPAAK